MKRQYIPLLLAFFSVGSTYAQLSPKVGGNPYLIESSAAFEVESTTKGLLYPRMSTIQRDAIGVAATGLTIYNTTVGCLQWYRGAANGGWFNPCAAGSETGSGGTAVFKGYQADSSYGQMVVYEAVSGVSVEIAAEVVTSGTYSIIASANGVTYAAAGTITDEHVGFDVIILLTASGTPQSGGTYNYVFSNSSPAFSFTATAIVATIVSTETGKVWMDRNLGASRQATSFDDYLAYGNLYQWGRPSDGHQIIKWSSSNAGTPLNGSTTTTSGSNLPVNSLFIVNGGGDWRTTQYDELWQEGSQVNNPCPVGFHVPTIAEWDAETNITDIGSAFTQLKLVVGGARSSSTAVLYNRGKSGNYWSATVIGSEVNARYFAPPSTGSFSGGRAEGCSVRCLKD